VAAGSRRVIAGVSGSLRSLGALRAGVAEARTAGAALLAVLAWAPAGGEIAYKRAPCPLLLKLWEQEACDRLRHAFDEAFGGIPDGVAVRPMVVRGPPGPVLVELADRRDDLLVVGHGGRSRLGHAFHGAVTRYCLAHARCPVLAVPPPELIRESRARRHHWRPEDFAVPLSRLAVGLVLGGARGPAPLRGAGPWLRKPRAGRRPRPVACGAGAMPERP
jgi:nucleotide-binding universal stress UspA family protein